MSDTELLEQAINNARDFKNFPDILMAVSLHPEWLTLIPEHRKWAILHQVILSGDVDHLNQLLALQKSNKTFRLLTNTRDNQTVLDIAKLRKDVPVMEARIKHLIKLDELLSYAKDCKWDQCLQIIRENPNIVNEKPPYRRFYLIHHMACANAIKEFEEFKRIKDCVFYINLRADRKKINVIAREENQPEFAAHMEKNYPILLDSDDPEDDEVYTPSEEAKRNTNAINALMEQKAIVKDLDRDLMGESTKPKSRAEVLLQINELRTQRDKELKDKSSQAAKAEEQQNQEMMVDNLTCPLTFCIFVDPGRLRLKYNIQYKI